MTLAQLHFAHPPSGWLDVGQTPKLAQQAKHNKYANEMQTIPCQLCQCVWPTLLEVLLMEAGWCQVRKIFYLAAVT